MDIIKLIYSHLYSSQLNWEVHAQSVALTDPVVRKTTSADYDVRNSELKFSSYRPLTPGTHA